MLLPLGVDTSIYICITLSLYYSFFYDIKIELEFLLSQLYFDMVSKLNQSSYKNALTTTTPNTCNNGVTILYHGVSNYSLISTYWLEKNDLDILIRKKNNLDVLIRKKNQSYTAYFFSISLSNTNF